MNRFWLICIAGMITLITLSSCSKEYRKYTQWSRKGTISEKDSAAFFFFKRGDYEKASYIFEELQTAYRGSERAKDVLYHYAYSKYNGGFYIIGAYYFEQYSKLYPNDPRTEECSFMIGYCYYLESDPHYLDQNFTKKTIEQLQLFLNTFPYSDKTEQCNKLMTEMREKLARKEFETAKLYYRIENFKAAVTAFEVMTQEYPDSRYREEAQLLHFKSAVSLADVSVDSKKKNRYLDALDLYQEFVDKYPNSVFLKEAENLFVKAKRSLGKIMATEASG